MLDKFIGNFEKLQAHHQTIFALIIFIGVAAIWWAGYVLFDVYFLPQKHMLLRIALATIFGAIILLVTHNVVSQL